MPFINQPARPMNAAERDDTVAVQLRVERAKRARAAAMRCLTELTYASQREGADTNLTKLEN